MQEILEAIQTGASGDDIANLTIPESTRAAHVLRSESGMWEGVESWDKDPRKSLHVGDLPLPELAPDEVVIAVMASSINFNTVWTSIFEPLPTFGFLDRLGKESVWGARHAQDFHIVGSDASGVVLRTGSAVRNWKPGDRIVAHCNHVDDQDPSAHNDSMLAANQRIWGFETNYGGLADLSIVKANQLMPKPAHLTWEESAVNGLCASTSYRMLVGDHAGRMKQGDNVFIWGATGGIGAYATQLVLNGGGTPIGVVSLRGAGEAAQRHGLRRGRSTARPRTTSSGRTSTPRTSRSGVVWARRSGRWWARTPTSSSSTPGADHGRLGVRHARRAARSSPAPPPPAT